MDTAENIMIFGNKDLHEGTPERPLVTFALFAYNQEEYVRDAIHGALSQTYSPLEIIISDDHSADKTHEIILEETSKYKGPHKIIVNRNESNIGLIEHVNKIFELANGQLIVAAAGDDVSLPIRTERIHSTYIKKNKPLLIHSKAFEIDQHGRLTGKELPHINLQKAIPLHKASTSRSLYLGATGAWDRSLFTKYGRIVNRNAYEDLILGFRATMENKMEFINEPLINYRTGSGITTKRTPTTTLRKYLNERKKIYTTLIDVQRQRIKDWSKSGLNNSEIAAAMHRSLLRHEQTLTLLNHPREIPLQILKKPITSLICITFELAIFTKRATQKTIPKSTIKKASK